LVKGFIITFIPKSLEPSVWVLEGSVLSLLPLSRYLVKKEDEDTGIVWNTRIRVEEFINILKKFDAFLGIFLEIKERLRNEY
jgi:hypothetical protein